MRKLFVLTALVAAIALSSCGPDVRIVTFDTKPQGFFKGDSVKLYWVVEHADEVTLDGVPVNKDSGWVKVRFDTTRTYILNAKNGHSERTNKMHVVSQN
ncbi:MAG: hypothetical protein JSS75_08610 [Bacteroidetes bacterium]|nr:hypothetical protein [Bacteroidota bacterium]